MHLVVDCVADSRSVYASVLFRCVNLSEASLLTVPSALSAGSAQLIQLMSHLTSVLCVCACICTCVCVCVWYCRRFVKSESLMKNFVYICFRKEKKKRFTWLNFTRTCPVHIFPFGEKKKNENKILEFSLKFPKHMFLHCYLIFMQIKHIYFWNSYYHNANRQLLQQFICNFPYCHDDFH